MISIYKNFLKRNYLFRKRAEHIYSWPTRRPEWEFRYLSSALLSDMWQVWCGFCRAIIIKSCAGTTTKTGKIIPARTSINSWQRIAYEALKAIRNQPVNSASTIRFKRHEPTWGDINVLFNAIPALSPANSATLITGFGLSLLAPKHMQSVRNACAHINSESMDEIRNIMIYYNGNNLSHPIDLMWWTEPSSKTDAIFYWINELEIIADEVTK